MFLFVKVLVIWDIELKATGLNTVCEDVLPFYPRGFITSCASDETGLVRLAGGEPGYLTSVEMFII